jgi:hypothetical protein
MMKKILQQNHLSPHPSAWFSELKNYAQAGRWTTKLMSLNWTLIYEIVYDELEYEGYRPPTPRER